MALTVLKPFRHAGVEYHPGDPAPADLHPDVRDNLVRMRHLTDGQGKKTPGRTRNELQVVENTRADWVIAPGPTGQYIRGAPVQMGGDASRAGNDAAPIDGRQA